MKGIINTWLPEKGYGFIKGDDGKDYYFNIRDLQEKSHISALAEALPIAFDQQATPKGYRARKSRLLALAAEIRYITPEHFMISRNDHIKGWEIMESGAWIVFASSASSPDDAREATIAFAQKTGANALLRLKYAQSTGSEPSENGKGTHYYTIHHFSGVIATLAKRHGQGKLTQEDLSGLNARAASLYEEWQDEHASRGRWSWIGVLLMLVMGYLSFVSFGSGYWPIGIICALVALIGLGFIHDYRDHISWIKPCPPEKTRDASQ